METRVREIIKAIRDGVSRGPFWLADSGLYIRAHRKGFRLWHATPHYANPLSPLSPVVKNAGYKGNRLIREYTGLDGAAYADCMADLNRP